MNTSDVINDHIPKDWAAVEQDIEKATFAFEIYRCLPNRSREDFLRQIAVELANDRERLIETCSRESHLPEARLQGELDRTLFQIQLFADLLKEGSWINAIIDTAIPERRPIAKPDIRQMQVPLGPVCVYGASNFPFAFSVAGGDTISSLAAGCPVLYKVHPNQPETAHLTATCIAKAAHKTGMPDGVFASLWLTSQDIGIKIVSHPLVKAVGFTGSYTGGMALYNAAARRTTPIPVYAEMSSINPVFLLPGRLAEQGEKTASMLVASNVLGAGQFCTNPGLLVLIESEDTAKFLASYAEQVQEQSVHRMLSAGIYQAYREGIAQLKAAKGASLLASGQVEAGEAEQPVPTAIRVSGRDFLSQALYSKEYFGPASVLVTAANKEELLQIAASLNGQLTASVWCTEEDTKLFDKLFQVLEEKAGRLIVNGAPTGVEVCHAMVHGGPFPATTDGRSTSVGTQAIYRFTRPLSYQNYPQHLLPIELQDSNPQHIWRRINGEVTKNEV
ncbi:aldehyde dehydrogenase (NADP(+)) [Olivibacter domesticus]|uniref:NADP-dependent aldehyde dehydrogenase n=1 Tax=Olivibacter domesticus TaxID=407022 RepID=A0A1H7MGC8_OLID1|nr:aldehyde dehydrogenase (NADP(+)) [Olivibacter domesticus]SEL10129.1 NADP-dependent aldehyde dehydrogenase [Olivibacter domesticus]